MMFSLKLRRIVPVFLCCSILLSCSLYPNHIQAESENREAINLEVYYTGKNTYKLYPQKFTKIDLRPYVNRSFIDEVAGDGAGGWSDQGNNDFRTFKDRGANEYLGVPFDIIEPNSNGGKSVIVIPGQGDTSEDCKNPVEINLNGAKAGGFYFLHTTAYAGDYVSGTYTVNYTDGTSAYFDLLNSVHIYNNWGKNENVLCRVAWQGSSEATSQGISLGLFALNNPHPEKAIKSITASTTGFGPYMMIVGLTLTDVLPALPAFSDDDITHNPTTSNGWIEYTPGDNKKIEDSILDMSKYLDAPAGKHGKLRATGEKFVFEDGTSIKFWGTNLSGNSCFPDKALAEKLAKSIAQCGYNVVRLTEFDGKGGLLNDDGVTVDKEKLDKMAYLIYQLEQRGIYTYMTFTSLREITDNVAAVDNIDVSNGFKLKGFIDSALINAQKDFIKQILSYESPYNNKRIGDIQSLAMVEFMDSNSMFEYTSGYSEFSTHSKEYRAIIKKMFNEYLKEKYSTTAALKKAWPGEYDIQPHENLEESNIELKSVWRDFLYSPERISDIQMFFARVQLDYYNEMKNALDEIGVDVLATCNSNAVGNIDTADSYMNSKTDFVSRKAVWPEPSVKTSRKLTDNMVLPHYNSVISDKYGGIIGEIAKNRVLGSPYVVSAWSVLETNPYISEMPLIMAAMSARQGWNAIQYSFAVDDFNFDGSYKIEDFYSSYNHPLRMAMMPVSAMLFYTTEEDDDLSSINYTDYEIHSFDNMDEYEKKELIAKVYDAKWYDNKWMYFYNPFIRIANHKLLGSKFGIEVSDTSDKKERMNISNYEKISDDGMVWDISEDTFKIETDTVQAATGVLSKPVELDNLYFELGVYADGAAWGTTVSLISSDGNSIADSDRMLLTTVARAFNSEFQSTQVRYDSIIKSPKTSGLVYNPGEAPVMLEPVIGNFVLKIKGDYDVYALTSSGERNGLIKTQKNDRGYLSFNISNTNASQHYEIIKR